MYKNVIVVSLVSYEAREVFYVVIPFSVVNSCYLNKTNVPIYFK